ncbi:MAG: glutaredoxin [Bdellovibrionia bacterium]
MSKKVVIYTKDPCPFCVRAIQFMKNRHIEFEEIDLTGNQAEIDRIKHETGWMTVPIILIDGQLIGGYTDLKNLDEEGKLMPLLESK